MRPPFLPVCGHEALVKGGEGQGAYICTRPSLQEFLCAPHPPISQPPCKGAIRDVGAQMFGPLNMVTIAEAVVSEEV